ncbi:protein disulfide oxidoreductase [Acholeplasma granularum]|uniref:protein disulfide oxidoreductase n=1 Tax=Acholeplasma granularum TaxID=264635 RepID=UPI00046EB91C|nr:thioredoxin family protein [Acholeplasma granularum]
MNKLLNQDVANQIKEVLKMMENDITVIFFGTNKACEMCEPTAQLLNEVKVLNPKITLLERTLEDDAVEASKYGVTYAPTFVILDQNKNFKRFRFNGIPAGHEINSLISSLIDSSTTKPFFDQKVMDRIAKIDKNVNIKVFVTLGCPHCPGAVTNAFRLAMTNSNIEAEAYEAQTFYELSEKYNVSSVPKIIINDKYEFLGNQPIETFLNEIDKL